MPQDVRDTVSLDVGSFGDTGDKQVGPFSAGDTFGDGTGGDGPDGAVSVELLKPMLFQLLHSPRSSNAAKASAIRTLAEIEGLVGRFQVSPHSLRDTAVAELDRAGLVAELARLREACGGVPAVSRPGSAGKRRTKTA